MTKIKLTIMERLGIIRMLNQAYMAKGLDLTGLRKASKISEQCELTVDERKKIKWVDLPQGGANVNMAEANKLVIAVELGDDETKLIAELIIAKNEKKEFANTDTYILALAEKLGMKL